MTPCTKRDQATMRKQESWLEAQLLIITLKMLCRLLLIESSEKLKTN